MVVLGGYYAKWGKSDREGQILYDLTHIWSLKNKLVNIGKKEQTDRYRKQTSIENKLVVASGGEGRREGQVWDMGWGANYYL